MQAERDTRLSNPAATFEGASERSLSIDFHAEVNAVRKECLVDAGRQNADQVRTAVIDAIAGPRNVAYDQPRIADLEGHIARDVARGLQAQLADGRERGGIRVRVGAETVEEPNVAAGENASGVKAGRGEVGIREQIGAQRRLLMCILEVRGSQEASLDRRRPAAVLVGPASADLGTDHIVLGSD